MPELTKRIRRAEALLRFPSRPHWAIALVVAALATSCGGGAIGDECEEEGAEDECEDGAVCGKPGDDDAVLECLKACEAQEDCPADQECNGIEGSDLKGCRTKSDTTGGSGGSGGK